MTIGFDDLRGEVLPGAHLVLRVPGVVAVVRRDEGAGQASSAELLELVRDVAREAGHEPGRELAARLTRWVVASRSAPGFGTIAATDDGVAVFLHGDVSAFELPEPGAAEPPSGLVHLSGRTAAVTVDEVLPWPDGPLVLAADAVPDPEGATAIGVLGWSGLVEGLVPGDGIVLGSRRSAAPAPAGRHAPTGAPPPDPAPAGPASPGADVAAGVTAAGVAGDQFGGDQFAGAPFTGADVTARRRHGRDDTGERIIPLPPDPGPFAPAPPDPGPFASRPPGPGAPVTPPNPPDPPPFFPPPAPPADAPAVPPHPPDPGPFFPPAPPTGDDDDAPGITPNPPDPPPFFPTPAPPADAPAVPPNPPDPGPFAAPSGTARPPSAADDDDEPQGADQQQPAAPPHPPDPGPPFLAEPPIAQGSSALGVLVLDTGARFELDEDYLFGRSPEADPGVTAGRLRPVRLQDDSGALSRVHAEIRVEGWDVVLVDRGSANGTYVARTGDPSWFRLTAHQPIALLPDTHIRVGGRTITFQPADQQS